MSVSVMLLGMGVLTSFVCRQRPGIAQALLFAATVCGVAYLARRYWLVWPMTPMFLGTVALPAVLGGLGWLSWRRERGPQAIWVGRGVLILAAGIGLLATSFPKDFYLPFVKTMSPFSHALLVFGVLG
ncbi:MAG: hypothetical protein JXQ84_04040, partial [Rhodospirillaceae bacterium]|nr:hypothetical protein [Rhodospirillaceae bacterium]